MKKPYSPLKITFDFCCIVFTGVSRTFFSGSRDSVRRASNNPDRRYFPRHPEANLLVPPWGIGPGAGQ